MTGKRLQNQTNSSQLKDQQSVSQKNHNQTEFFSFNSPINNSQNQKEIVNTLNEYDNPNYWIR